MNKAAAYLKQFGIACAPVKRKVKAKKNPAKRIGTARAGRPSQITGKKPTKRLVTRRKTNTKKGYFPNPRKAHGKYTEMHFRVDMLNEKTKRWNVMAWVADESLAKETAKKFHSVKPGASFRVMKI